MVWCLVFNNIRKSHKLKNPYKNTGGLRILGGNLSTEHTAVLKLAGVEGGLENNVLFI